MVNLCGVNIFNNEITKITSIERKYNVQLDVYKLCESQPEKNKDRYNDNTLKNDIHVCIKLMKLMLILCIPYDGGTFWM